MNLQMRQLEDDMIALLNASEAPIEAKRLIVRNVLTLIEKEADRTIIAEMRPITEYGENNAESVD